MKTRPIVSNLRVEAGAEVAPLSGIDRFKWTMFGVTLAGAVAAIARAVWGNG